MEIGSPFRVEPLSAVDQAIPRDLTAGPTLSARRLATRLQLTRRLWRSTWPRRDGQGGCSAMKTLSMGRVRGISENWGGLQRMRLENEVLHQVYSRLPGQDQPLYPGRRWPTQLSGFAPYRARAVPMGSITEVGRVLSKGRLI